MGSQQLLLILLGIILVGVAIVVGFSITSHQTMLSNRDAIIADITDLSMNALEYRSRPLSRAGGGGSYLGYQIPMVLASNENGAYAVISLSQNQISFGGSSPQGFGTIVATFGPEGRLQGSYLFTGKFE